MGRELRSIQEFFDGPADAPRPDDYCRGAIGKAMAKAADTEVRDILIEVRLTDAGTTTSRPIGEPMIVKADQDPSSVADALLEAMLEQIPDTWSGQLRVNFRDRQGGSNGYLGSCVRHVRPAPSAVTVVDGAPARGVVVLREPDAVRPWVDTTMRLLGHIERMAGHSSAMFAEYQKAMHSKDPTTLQQAALQLLPALINRGAAPGQAPAAPVAPVASSAPASWPFDPVDQRQISASTDVSSSSIEQQRPQPEHAPRSVTIEDVRAWATSNPDQARALVFEAMQNGQT